MTGLSADEVMVRRYRDMGPEAKLEVVKGLCAAADRLSRAGIRQRHPGADDREVFRRLVELKLGSELARRVYGPLPDER